MLVAYVTCPHKWGRRVWCRKNLRWRKKASTHGDQLVIIVSLSRRYTVYMDVLI